MPQVDADALGNTVELVPGSAPELDELTEVLCALVTRARRIEQTHAFGEFAAAWTTSH